MSLNVIAIEVHHIIMPVIDVRLERNRIDALKPSIICTLAVETIWRANATCLPGVVVQ